ncbi:putative zinc finger, SWIM-type containing 7 [Monocercomonoides exilis]|uniref:putative zinc finger, SWIM-type containing 7 n=1 Tax=Monocercomonoides exilis TaxID=2049356 RepID=UPI003559A020|nr:putative zinc finger, SWIM-type containing 7 [Monocercomonoides exilis]|eukprot:MONOS_6369.1-p1 / transcript=MONOS_6369.1 / gene=MONOS_6369 / organism=Monocercomonoides_exilis_PA203 / gene_product=zinc finger, SWIM-type containing 7 / transcript_product=zinc finger, SWIM-type containing 7 / location=Mono_scaffold00199:92561-93180(-) / protein_length=128 / sequence_SO=supercontig / SO=protein_coding / is_pseudo=false
MNSIVGIAARALFQQIKENDGCLTNEILLGLYFIFKKIAQEALTILEEGKITELLAPSGRSFYQMEGKNEEYLCFTHFCTCPSFMFSVILRQESPLCKHQLAACLGEAMGCIPKKPISEEMYEKAMLE